MGSGLGDGQGDPQLKPAEISCHIYHHIPVILVRWHYPIIYSWCSQRYLSPPQIRNNETLVFNAFRAVVVTQPCRFSAAACEAAGSGGASRPTVHVHAAIGSFSKGPASIGRIKSLGGCEILQRAAEFVRRGMFFSDGDSVFWGLMGMFWSGILLVFPWWWHMIVPKWAWITWAKIMQWTSMSLDWQTARSLGDTVMIIWIHMVMDQIHSNTTFVNSQMRGRCMFFKMVVTGF